MKKLKRFFCVFLVWTMMVSCTVFAAAVSDGNIEVSKVTAKAGGSAVVEISVKNNPGFAFLKLELSYDTNKLSLAKVEDGTVKGILNSFTLSSKKVNLLLESGNGNLTGDGTVAVLRFDVKSGASGTAAVSARFVESNNWELKALSFTVSDGSVTVGNEAGAGSGGSGTDSGSGTGSGGGTGSGSGTGDSSGTGGSGADTGSGGTVTPTPTLKEDIAYLDVESSRWYHDAVSYVTTHGLMNGLSSTADGVRFGPNASTLRSMVITVLARLDGVDTDGGSTWYAKAIEWAQKNGISDGTTPQENITREQLAAMLYRFARYRGYDVSARGDLSAYADAASVHDWARESVQWAVGCGLMNGINGKLEPRGTTTRAQLATMLMRFSESYLNA